MTLLVKNDAAQEPQLLKRKYTVEEFEQLFTQAEHGDRLLELIQGEVVEKIPTEEHGVVAGNVFAPIHNFVTPHEGETLSGEEMLPGFTLAVADILSILLPIKHPTSMSLPLPAVRVPL